MDKLVENLNKFIDLLGSLSVHFIEIYLYDQLDCYRIVALLLKKGFIYNMGKVYVRYLN